MAPSKRNSASKNWCFTLNNPTPEEEAHLRGLVDCGKASYVIIGQEVGATGTPHLQGYVEFPKRKRLSAAKKIPGFQRAHLETRWATQSEAVDYCKKDGQYIEYGLLRQGQGKRSDLEKVRQDLAAGKSIKDIADDDFQLFLQYRRGLEAYRALQISPRSWATYNIIYWGPTGTGKTRWATEQAKANGEYFVYAGTRPESPWFDGYAGQHTVLFDDFRAENTIGFDFLLRLLDRYPLKVPVKGDFVEWCPRKIFITSNRAPELWYPGKDKSPLWRRVNRCTRITAPLYDDIFEYGTDHLELAEENRW